MAKEVANAKLLEYIGHPEKQQELVSDYIVYDKETLNMLHARLNDMFSGKDRTVTLEQTIDNIRQFMKLPS